MTASLVSRDSWADLIPPDDLPERDVYADLGDGAPPSEARREAEKLFGRFVADQKPVPTQVASEAPVPTAPELVAPVRVLPDLLAVAREEERRAGEAPKPKRAAKGAGTTKPRKKIEQARTQVGVRVIDPPAQPSGMLNGHAEARDGDEPQSQPALNRSSRLDSGGRNGGCRGSVGIAEADHQHLRVRSTRRGR